MKIFGSTQYVHVEGQFKMAQKEEVFLQFVVKSQWDWNDKGYFLVRDGEFTYYIVFAAKSTNDKYSLYKYAKEEDITEEHRELINNYINGN